MLDNLSPRERILAIVVTSLVPLVLLFGGFVWFNSLMESKQNEVSRLSSSISREKARQMEALLASERRQQYRQASLPTDREAGFNLYFDWLFDLAKKAGLDNPQLTKAGEGKKNVDSKVVYYHKSTTLTTFGTIEQVTDFLYRFHQKKTLHKIKAISLNPTAASLENTASASLDQRLRVTFTIEAISMPDADCETQLPAENWNRLAGTVDDYKARIVHRDIFGPPNNAPKFGTISPGKPEPARDISFAVPASDADKDDLTFELVSAGSKGAKLEITDDGRAYFKSPGLDEGNYSYEVKVTDNGCPAKIDTRKFSFTVAEKPKRDPPKKEVILDATLTNINSLTKNAKGKLEVWVNFQSKGKRQTFEAGESFELDDKEWTVLSHDYKTCTIRCGDEILKYESGSLLSEPIDKYPAGDTAKR